MRTRFQAFSSLVIMLVTTMLFTAMPPAALAARQGVPYKVVDSSSRGYDYAYAPSIAYHGGTYHVWYGSEDNVYGWDSIRYATSADGVTWSAPSEVLRCSNYNLEHCCCDPTVVFYQGYWYCFYSGCWTAERTVNCVARASQPGGPFYKYTQRGTWEINPADPKIIIGPRHTTNNDGYYGAGGATVVVRNDRLYMWYKDDTLSYPGAPASKIMFTSTTNPVVWPTATETNLAMSSSDVEWDEHAQQFVHYVVMQNHDQSCAMQRYYSRDGITWSGPFNVTDIPDYSHNIGILRNATGQNALNGKNIISYGAPYDLSASYTNQLAPPSGQGVVPYCWGYWDLYAHAWNDPVYVKGDFDGDGKLDPAMVDTVNGKWYIRSSSTGQQGVPGIPWGWQWGGMTSRHQLICGDYDGDGTTDRAIVDLEAAGGARWFVIGSTSGLGTPQIPWNSQWMGVDTRHTVLVADYDGDGVTDRAIVDLTASGGSTWYVLGSTSGLGTPDIPWGCQWPGTSIAHTPLVGDFDGDGIADMALVDRHASGGMTWYVIGSTSGLGTPDIPWAWQWSGVGASYALAIEDYDGDERLDRAVIAPGADSKWYVYSSITHGSSSKIPWGSAWGGMNDHHQIVAGDYDGDGEADQAILGPDFGSGACWYVTGNSGIPWGWALQPGY